MRSVKIHWGVGFKDKRWLSEVVFWNIIHMQTYNWKSMRSVKVHWVVGFKQKQWFSEKVFQNNIHIQTYSWTNYALCESTLSGGLQAEAMSFRTSFQKHYTHSNIQLIKVCARWNYTEWWASSRNNSFQKRFFEKLYTFKHTIEQIMRSVKVHWGVGFKEKRWLSEVVFWNIIHTQTYNWRKCALCQSSLSVGLQAETMAFRRSFLKHYTHANIQLNKVCALWKYTEWWASSRCNVFQNKFSKTLYTFTHTIEQSMRSLKVHLATEPWASSRSNGFQSDFFETLYTFKHTIEQSMRSVKLHWVVGFKQKQ